MSSKRYAVGVDLGGTKIAVALVDDRGEVLKHARYLTFVREGPEAVRDQIIAAVKEIRKGTRIRPAGIGIGVAGQIARDDGMVRFAPNLGWRNVPLGEQLRAITRLRVVVVNDVRAAAAGEWAFGAGKDCADLICMFVGTGIGGGIVTQGRMLHGCGNSAGEIGHVVVDMNGPLCHCGRRGCMEALAGGWAIAQKARDAILLDPALGTPLLRLAKGQINNVTTELVATAFRMGDPLARQLIDRAADALSVGAVSLVNAFNPCRLILGGGVVNGLPELIERVREGIRHHALVTAAESVTVVPASLGDDAGVIGAAVLAMQSQA